MYASAFTLISTVTVQFLMLLLWLSSTNYVQNGEAKLSTVTRLPKPLLLLHFQLRAILIYEELTNFDNLSMLEILRMEIFFIPCCHNCHNVCHYHNMCLGLVTLMSCISNSLPCDKIASVY